MDLLLPLHSVLQVCIQKFPDWPSGARTVNGTTLCHYVQLYRYFVSQSSEFCRHNPFVLFLNECLLLLRYISLSTQSGNFLIHLHFTVVTILSELYKSRSSLLLYNAYTSLCLLCDPPPPHMFLFDNRLSILCED
jgi:hypothetical protein